MIELHVNAGIWNRQVETYSQDRPYRFTTVEKVEAMRTKQRASEQELDLLFQALMQRAFKGELVS